MAERAKGPNASSPPTGPRAAKPGPVEAEVSDARPDHTSPRSPGSGPEKATKKLLPRRRPAARGGDRAEQTWRLRPRGRDPEEVRARWGAVQSEFVDDPTESVRAADVLASEIADAAIAAIEARRAELRTAWEDGNGSDTEALRLALRDYRAFVKHLIGDA